MTAARRLAAILATDIVGYSRLMGAMLTRRPSAICSPKWICRKSGRSAPRAGGRLKGDGRLLALRSSSRCGPTMKRITTLFASGVLALALFGAARAGPFEDAQAAIRKATTRRKCGFCVHWPSKGTPSLSSALA